MKHTKTLIVFNGELDNEKERVWKAIDFVADKYHITLDKISDFETEDIVTFRESHILKNRIHEFGYVIVIGDQANNKINKQYTENGLVSKILPPISTWAENIIKAQVVSVLEDFFAAWKGFEFEKKLIVLGSKIENHPIVSTEDLQWFEANLSTFIKWLKIEVEKDRSFALKTVDNNIEIRDISKKLRAPISQPVIILSNNPDSKKIKELAVENGFINCYLVDFSIFEFILKITCSSAKEINIKIKND